MLHRLFKHYTGNHELTSPEDHGDSPLQREFEVELDDLHGRQGEIAFRLRQETQTFVLMFGAIAAIGGSQLLIQAVPGLEPVVRRNPWTILLGAAILLWFPIYNIISWADIGVAAAYINQVAVPRLRLLIEFERDRLLTPAAKSVIQEREQQALGRWSAPLVWEPYRAEHFYAGTAKYALLPLWTFRTLLLFTPSAIALAIYLNVRLSRLPVGMSWPDILVVIVYTVLATAIILALRTTANLPQMHLNQPDPVSRKVEGD